jgi:uncharacterized protein YqgV (UPF0045/DUF77 family)
MIMTVEISMYPFCEDYRTPILAFIAQLNTYAGLRVSTSPTATLVSGDFHTVMQTLTELLAWSHQQHGKAVYVTKFIPVFDPD